MQSKTTTRLYKATRGHDGASQAAGKRVLTLLQVVTTLASTSRNSASWKHLPACTTHVSMMAVEVLQSAGSAAGDQPA